MTALFSANAHVIEPPHLFTGRVPAKWAERVPRLVSRDGGGQQWVFEDRPVAALHRTCCMGGAVNEPEWRSDVPGFHVIASLDDLRPGCYDAACRVEDMDIDGIAAAVCTSHPAGMGFAGDVFASASDPELGLAVMRAWNDWYLDEWVGTAPERFVPVGYTWYLDPEVAAEEVRKNAARGFRAVAFRNPIDLGEPWFGSGHWDPLLRACEETNTVIVHHTEAAARAIPTREGDRYAYGMTLTLYQLEALDFVTHCVWGGVPARFPNLKIHIAESGGSWLPHLLQRLNFNMGHSVHTRDGWPDRDLTPLEAIRRTFVFSTQELAVAHQIEQEFGIGGWMMEDDYPHIESIWPGTAEQFTQDTERFDAAWVEGVAWRNASELFRFPLPKEFA